MDRLQNERSLGELFAELSRETGTLLRQEVELAKVEVTQKATRWGRNAASVAVGGAVAYASVLTLVAAMVIGLVELGLQPWVSALVVGLLAAVLGYVLIQRGLDALKKEDVAPRQTIETLKEDAAWIKRQTR